MNEINIEKAHAGDVAAIVQIVNQAYRPIPGAEGWTHEAEWVSGHRVSAEHVATAVTGSAVLVARRGSAVMGCVQIEVSDRKAQIGMLAVSPAAQNAGMGKLLLAKAENYAAQHFQAEEAILLLIAQRIDLLRFYLRRGYEETGEVLPYPVDAQVGIPRKANIVLTVLRKSL